MINRLVYEVRLKKTSAQPKAARGKPWRWDVTYYATTDPEYSGVETGRYHLGSEFGYDRTKRAALRNISRNILDNPYKEEYEER